ncbi:hypothetical protein Enr13x_74440 [Stieleria neptunia]|uniref:Uncharacterized protein n=1 Tax=Stieleria neptunia TaxID=2527979 RepID=A0A518I396_9BACT|nr:hypothetical protein [Stieleria neptunia]QDV47534.1 hypothetical protein Enr13x_74440 [Stieleria neptunia]
MDNPSTFGMWLAITGFVVFIISAVMIVAGLVLHYLSAKSRSSGAAIASKGGLGMLVFLALMVAFTVSFQTHKLGLSPLVQALLDILAVAVGVLAVFFSPGGWIFRNANVEKRNSTGSLDPHR